VKLVHSFFTAIWCLNCSCLSERITTTTSVIFIWVYFAIVAWKASKQS
jgi:hypothetical protein